MKQILSFDQFINESHTDKYYTIAWNRKNEKDVYEFHTKVLDTAEKAIPVVAETLERLYPGKFDTTDIGFAFRGNSSWLYCNVKNPHDKFEMNSDGFDDEIRTKGEFSKYFDVAGINVSGDGSMKLYSHSFRLKSY
jgi:hypothetical protein